jgi:prepilin-type N-terminal cleavage/methylation domain-containing protein
MIVIRRRLVVAHTCRRWRRGVTLVEVLVAIGIIGLLAAIALPAVQAARNASQRMRCANNQRQLLIAISGYHEQYGVFPPYPGWPDATGCRRETAITRLFPFVGLTNICDILSSDVRRLPILECPSDPEITLVPTPLSYILNASPGENSGAPWHGPFEDGRNFGVRASDVTDGLSNTAGLSESIALRAGGTAANAKREPLRYSWNVFVPPTFTAVSVQLGDAAVPSGESPTNRRFDCRLPGRFTTRLHSIKPECWRTMGNGSLRRPHHLDVLSLVSTQFAEVFWRGFRGYHVYFEKSTSSEHSYGRRQRWLSGWPCAICRQSHRRGGLASHRNTRWG